MSTDTPGAPPPAAPTPVAPIPAAVPAPDTGRGGCIGVLIPEHFLLGVQRTPVSGQFYVEFEGLPYVLMETAGPGVVPAGVVGDSTKAYIDGGGKFSLRRIY